MKKIFALLLMLVAMSSFAQKSKFVKGHFIGISSPYVVYYTYSDLENKENDVWVWNTATNKLDSLSAIEAKIVDNSLYYCDFYSLKKRHLARNSDEKDSILFESKTEIENFYIENGNLLVTEIDSSYRKVNIIYYVDDVCIFRESVPCHPEEMEYQIVQIDSFEDYFVISVQYDLYIFDKRNKILVKIAENCNYVSMDRFGNIYYDIISQEDYSEIIYASNVKELKKKVEILKNPGRIHTYYYLNGTRKGCSVFNGKLYELDDMQIKAVQNIRISYGLGRIITYNPKEEYFVLDY